MSLPFKHRAFLPACLTLGALLCSLPALADADSSAAPAAPTSQTILLQHVVPGYVLKNLHWDQAASLPAGVTRISAQPATNSLSVVATPAGLAKVRQIVRLVDIEPRQVQIKFALAKTTTTALDAYGFDLNIVALPGPKGMPPAFMGYATGKEFSQFLQALTKQGAVLQAPTVVTTNNVDAALNVTGGQPVPALPNVVSFTFSVTPRVNSDDTVTLALHPQADLRVPGKTNPDGTPAIALQDLRTLRTVRSGDTMVITNLFPGAAGAGNQLLLFVTPTILPTGGGMAAVTVK